MLYVSCWRQCRCFLPFLFRCLGASLEAIAVVAGLQNVAAMCKAIEQCGGHFGIAEYVGPFAEAQGRGYDDAGTLIKFA